MINKYFLGFCFVFFFLFGITSAQLDVDVCVGVVDACGVCNGTNSTCSCSGDNYLGYNLTEVDYALLRWSLAATLVKINQTLDILYAIKQELPYYDYRSGLINLGAYLDILHTFCDECLDDFDFAQAWFADILAGNCVGDGCSLSNLKAYDQSN